MVISGRTGGPGFSIPYITADSTDSASGRVILNIELMFNTNSRVFPAGSVSSSKTLLSGFP